MADSGKPFGPSDPSGPVSNGPVYGFTEQGFNRVTRATKLVEKELIPAAVGRSGRGPVSPGTRLKVAKVQAGGITARSGMTMGRGNVELCDVKEVGSAKVASPNGTVVEVVNLGGSIPQDVLILVAPGPWGWWPIVVPCS